MGLLRFLFGRTPKITDAVPEFQLEARLAAITVWTPANETPTVLAEETAFQRNAPGAHQKTRSDYYVQNFWEDAETAPTEPIFCMIDYIDASGNRTRRRVTIRRVIEKNGALWIGAHCHERGAARTFRADRIQSFITMDGEVIGSTAFFDTYLDVRQFVGSNGPIKRHRKPTSASAKANFRMYTKPHVIILTAMAIVDDHLHASEVETVLRFIEDEGFTLNREAITAAAPDIDTLNMIERRIYRIRPTREDLAEAFSELRNRPTSQIDRLKTAVAKVVAADGTVHLSEEMFVSDIDRFLTQSSTTAWAELDLLVAQL